jgi:iron complex transport system ATP-binding protein
VDNVAAVRDLTAHLIELGHRRIAIMGLMGSETSRLRLKGYRAALRRAGIAQAIVNDPELLLLDEPTTHLDPPHQVALVRLFKRLARDRTVVSVLHELPMALAADEMVVMDKGRVVHHGGCDDPATHTALEQVFDHRIRVHRVADQWIALPK